MTLTRSGAYRCTEAGYTVDIHISYRNAIRAIVASLCVEGVGVRESGWLLAHNAPQFFEYGHVYLWSLNDSHASSDAESVAGAYKVRYTVLGKYLADVIVMSDVWDVAVLPYHFDYVSKYKHMTLIYFVISWSFNIEVHRFSSVNTGSHREMLLLWSGNFYAHWLDCLHYTKETEYCD